MDFGGEERGIYGAQADSPVIQQSISEEYSHYFTSGASAYWRQSTVESKKNNNRIIKKR